MASKTKVTSNDGYVDVVKAIGTKSGAKTEFLPENVDYRKLARVYRFDGIGKNICNCVADDGTAPGFEIDGDSDGSLLKNVLKTGLRRAYKRAARWTRAFGGAVVVMKIADSRKLDEEAGKGNIVGFNVYPCSMVNVGHADYDTDQMSPNFGDPKWFTVTMRNGDKVRVHRSRCEVFYGEEVPSAEGMESSITGNELIFGDSALVAVMKRLEKLGMSEEGIADMMSELNVAYYQWKGFDAKLSMKDGLSLVKRRMEAVEMGKSTNRAIIGDIEDKYTVIKTDLAGVPETTYRQMQLVAAAAQLPVAKIFGESSSGLSTTGEGNRKMYDKKVETWMEDHITEQVEHLVSEILVRNLGKDGDVTITWNSVTQPTDEEFTKMVKDQSEYFHTFIEDGVLTPEEVRTIMFKNGHTFKLSLPEEKPEEDEE